MPLSNMTGEEFREIRLALGYTQTEIADIFGLNYRTVGRWELGQTKIPKVYEIVIKQMPKADVLRKSNGGR